MTIITLLTDFGLHDPFVGVMKGVILSIASQARIVDLTHDIPPQNIMEGALALAEAAPYFPQGTIHVCVVDPGVGTERRPMLAVTNGQYYIGPDNGLFSLLTEKAKDLTTPPLFIHLNKPRFWLPRVSNSFHGRDIFAPVAAHLAIGTTPEELGDPFENPVVISIPKPLKTDNGWQGQVLRIDHFGNLVTNLTSGQLEQTGRVNLHVKDSIIHEISQTFGNHPTGDLLAMIDSCGYLSICLVNGNAAQTLGIQPGEMITLHTSQGAA